MDRFSFLNSAPIKEIAEIYDQYLQHPDKIEISWRNFFQGYDFALQDYPKNGSNENGVEKKLSENVHKEFKVINLIQGYRTRGHLFTKTNPVRERRKYPSNMDIKNFGLATDDLDKEFDAGEIVGLGKTSLRKIIAHLEKGYCESIGIEYMYMRDPLKIQWIQDQINLNENKPNLSKSQKKQIFKKLNEAVLFENFLHTKYVGQKRFSVEGLESLIPAIDTIIERSSANFDTQEFYIGMAHRGRLNVLSNIFDKQLSSVFNEFEGKDYNEEALFDGDVKYHLSLSIDKKTKSGKNIRMNLAPNPSHLETVNPVIEGMARAKIDNEYEGNENKVLPILIHGDAAIAGQGIVYEVVQMSKLKGYKTGGTLHIVTNNQVGFTTNYMDARSSIYCTDVGKVTLSPIFHVNADDVEAVIQVINIALDFRMKFNQDVFVDLLGYRRYGHNEGDEPRFTQPNLYKTISKHPNVKMIYKDKLLSNNEISEGEIDELETSYKKLLDEQFSISKQENKTEIIPFNPSTVDIELIEANENDVLNDVDTTVKLESLEELANEATELPEGFNVIKKIQRLIDDRRKGVVELKKVDWGMGEILAFATLLKEGHNIRLSGQDVERGTFSHRHALIKSEDATKTVVPLKNLKSGKGKFHIFNSLLSEYGVLGFEYGYSLVSHNTLTIWEAQFGDFHNGAQIIIDQYISSAEDKWKIQNGLVMLLPHGYEGQGSEHSSARIERFLQLCADSNMIIANCSTPANLFHLLRKQIKQNFRKPLVIFTPKSLLRHPECVSELKDLAEGKFDLVKDDPIFKANDNSKDNTKNLVLCSGKIYYDLIQKRRELEKDKSINLDEFAIIRLEMLYPLPQNQIDKILSQYKNVDRYMWVQEEPKNMGVWPFLLQQLNDVNKFEVVSREPTAATAAGSFTRSRLRHNKILNTVFKVN